MVGLHRYVRALVATCAVAAGLTLAVPGPPADAHAPTRVTTPAAAPDPAVDPLVDTAPLGVTITSMTPAVLQRTGTITITGTVTNRTEETWTGISLYALVGDGAEFEPMRNPSRLAQAMETPYDDVVGYRKTEVGSPGRVDELAAGVSANFTITLPASSIEVSRAGVYWFGVHALGASPSSPSDGNADGRARTFLPFVPPRFDATPLDATVVVPLSQPVTWAADGSVDDVEAWMRALDGDGRLTRLLDFVEAGDRPVTWLVDPAMIDAVAHIAAGNQPRTLGPVGGDEPSEGGETSGSGSGGSDGSGDDGGTAELSADALPPSAQIARTWLDELGAALRGDEVLTLPYGNIDVPATLAHAPELLPLALAQRSTALRDLGIETRPVITSPSGYLDPASIRAADPDTRVLVTDRMFGDQPPAAADANGRRLLVTSYGAAQGSPGPGSSLTSIGIRQRLLAEAAVRVVKDDRQPLVVVLPLGWRLDDAAAFWDALDQPWLDLGGLSDVDAAATPVPVDPFDLDYTALQGRRELDAPVIDAVSDLIAAGDTLQNVLVDNTEIGGTLTEEALSGISYFVRNGQTAGRLSVGASRDWVDERLGGVRITASDGVTLSSANGEFVVNLTNELDHRVAVTVRARSDAGIEVEAPERIVLPPGGRDAVVLTARTTTNSVHNVELLVTDASGTPLGSSAELPIRPTRVSGVIWIIMGTGAGLLFLAIAVRLVRRVRAARRGEPGAGRRGSRPRPEAGATTLEVV